MILVTIEPKAGTISRYVDGELTHRASCETACEFTSEIVTAFRDMPDERFRIERPAPLPPTPPLSGTPTLDRYTQTLAMAA